MKVYDAASIRNVAVVGHGGCGKTQLVSAMLFAAGAVNRLGQGRRRLHRHRFRRRSHRPQAHPGLQPRPCRMAEDQDQPHRHPRVRQLPHRRPLRPARRRGAPWSWSMPSRRRSPDREALVGGRVAEPAAHRRRQPARARSREPGAHAGVAAPRLRARDRPDSAADWRGDGISPASSTWFG